ncbi:MAG: patatin-like phospholipase family protein, partial [Xanthobacteraceae bacterium]|nr:patatin-like phospholipase family protein [Xanthobacteraceae bacterium]
MDARTPHHEQTISNRGWRPERCDRVALVLQGGGALGAYQAGVYQALHESGIEPDWVCGVSIGAINSAIIAGNPPDRRLERLQIL